MTGPGRRRVDLTRLPTPARYALALAVLAVVVVVVLLVDDGDPTGQPATWYTVVVTIGAVALIVYLALRAVLWAAHRGRRR